MTDYYNILGISRDSTESQIKKAYYKLAKEWHPDKHENEQKVKAEAKFKQISEAYQVLSDEKARKVYDQYGVDGLKAHMQQNGPGNMPDAFAHFFQNGFSPFGGPHQQRDVIQHTLKTPLRHFYKGANITFKINVQRNCNKCNGCGCSDPSQVNTCKTCNGAGQVMQNIQVGPGIMTRQVNICPQCKGTKKSFPPSYKCDNCNGNGKKSVSENVEFNIAKGMDYGNYIIRGKGNMGNDGSCGDIQVILVPDPNDKYTRKGADLYYDHDITLKEALVGFVHKILFIDNTNIVIKSTNIINPFEIKVLPNKGLPKNSDGRGNLYINFHIKFPKNIPEEYKKDLEKIIQDGSVNYVPENGENVILTDTLKTIEFTTKKPEQENTQSQNGGGPGFGQPQCAQQ